ncbi:MAG: LysM peptidoglycan-binding domain-containing protein, partial [Eubacteriales bacterium]|nr:LysM peptidoglycan-binding domain-containing protein [Eubacteriales bacterium]
MMGPIKRMITLSMKKAIRQTALLLLLCMMTALVCAAAGPEYLIHTVVPGDTLGKIARQYDTTADAIAELNGIVNKNIIAVGDQLKIPGTAAETTAEFIAETEPEPGPEPEITLPNVIGDPDPDTGLAGIYEDMNTVVSVNFSRTDIRDVLSAFAVNLGCNVIFKGTATEISLVLSDVTIGEALDYVMKLVDMTYIIDGRTIIVGQKRDLIQTFSTELQVAEFNLQYVTAATVMQQIRALEIEVTATAAGDNEYRFIAKGLPADLSKVRDLIRMIDKRENSLLDPAAVSSLFYSIDLKHIRAQDLQRVLAATWLPTGVVLPDRPYTLYVYATADDYRLIMNICRTVDIEAPAGSDIQLPQIKQVSLRYVTLDLIEGQITANADVSIIKIATNKSTFWLNGMPAQLNKAAEIIALLDTEANMQLSGRDIKDKFRPVTLDFIDAARFSQVLEGLSLPSGLVFGDNPKTLYIYATADEFIAISEVKAVVDKAENDAGTAAVFRPVTLRHITAAQFNETLANLSLPTGIIFPNNDKTLFIYAAPDVFDSINDMQRVVDLPDNAADADTEFITVVLRHITAEQFNSTLAAVNLPTGIIYSDNEYTLYVHATREEEDAINAIKSVVDAPQNNLNAGSKFRYITLRFMTADQFNDTLREMSLPTGLTFTNNPYTLYLYSTASEYRAVNDIKNMVDAP